MEGKVLERTIRNGAGFERVSLSQEEVREVNAFVMEYNITVVGECLRRAHLEFPDVEPDRRHQIALLLADKLALHSFTAHKVALDAKVGSIKDSMNGNGGDNHE